MILNGGTIYIPNSFDIYRKLIIYILEQIIKFENDYLNLNFTLETTIEEELKIKKSIKTNLEFINALFKDDRTKSYINTKLPVSSTNKILHFDDNDNIVKYINPLVIFVKNLKLNWIKNYILVSWYKYGGLDNELCGTIYIVEKDLIFFINEISKDLKSINKTVIKNYLHSKNNLYDLLDNESKKKLNTFLVQSIIKNNYNRNNHNMIFNFNIKDFVKLDKYYNLGIREDLLPREQINRIYNMYESYYENIPDLELTPVIIFEYNKILYLQNKEESLIDKKMSLINERYNIFILNKYTNDVDYKKNRDQILSSYNFLKSINYNFTEKQIYFIKKLNVQINLEGKIPHEFVPDIFFPLFDNDELLELKQNIIDNKNNLCDMIKNLFPLYAISHDIFCTVEPNNQKKYANNETINKTINFYCVVFLVIGIINYKLEKYNQNYMIILKGGKALQVILSEMNFTDDTRIKSNDIDLIINPVDGKNYVKEKCEFLASIICILIQWILNPVQNMYNKEYYVSYKLPNINDEYPYIIKLSHKIQYLDNYPDPKFTAIADFDFHQIEKKIFYSNLIHTKKKSAIGELIYIHQNLNDFLLEKIYFANLNMNLVEDKNNIYENINNSTENIDLLTNKIEENVKNINKLKPQINENLNQMQKINDSINLNYDQIKNINNYMIGLDNFIKQNQQYVQQYSNQCKQFSEMYKQYGNQYNKYSENYEQYGEYCKQYGEQYYIKYIEQYDKLDEECKRIILENDELISSQKILEINNNKLIEEKNNLENINNDCKFLIKTKNIQYGQRDNLLLEITKARRFIKKFTNQIKLAVEIITYDDLYTPENFLNIQEMFITNLINDNKKKIGFDEITSTKVVSIIFS